jgi:lipoate-protein ligase A
MAVDAAMLEAAATRGREEAIVRLYRWAAPALSVGAKQAVPQEVLDRCAGAGVDVVRRPTGGGAVLHRGDLTYAVAAPERGMSVLGIYRWVAEALAAGFAGLGLDARVVERSGTARPLACFALPTGADLEVAGRKVCGSAQVRRGNWFLQHGSIPVEDVRGPTAALLGPAAKDDSTCIQRERPGTGWDEVSASFEAGFRSAWGDPADVRPLDEAERAIVARLTAALVPV